VSTAIPVDAGSRLAGSGRGRSRGAASRRVAIVVHADYPADTRVRRQAEALTAAGFDVDIVALRHAGQEKEERYARITVHRLPVGRRPSGMVGHLLEYAAFGGLATLVLANRHRERRYALVQVAAPPDFLVFGALPERMAGVPVLLDLHEDMPAFYRDRFPAGRLRSLVALVEGVTRASAAAADRLLTVHEPLRRLSLARGVPEDRIDVVMNSADERIFDPSRVPRRAFMEDGELRLIHHSNLQRVYGLEFAIEAVALLRDLPVRLDVYGDGPYRPAIEEAIRRTGTDDLVRLHGAVPLESLPALLAGSDIGLVPTRPEPYAEYSLSTKLLEYAAMGVPVVASDLATFRFHFTEVAIRYVPGGRPDALAAAIREASTDRAAMEARGRRIREEAARYAWRGQAERYVSIVERLARRPPRARSAARSGRYAEEWNPAGCASPGT
jgi:glycosyltransferase involved in cell wall biosynthesis